MDFETSKDIYLLLSNQKAGEVMLNSNFKDDFFDISEGIISIEKQHFTKIASGNKLYDFILFNDGVNFAISERFHQLLFDNNITGWKSFPIIIKNFDEKYFGIQIIGRCGNIVKPEKRGFHIGYRFDIQTWDGSDLFSPRGTNLRFISNKLRLLIEKERISNILLENINEAEFYSPGKK